MKKFLYIPLFCFSTIFSFGQIEKEFTLEDIISIAQAESPQVKLAELRKSNAYWINQSYLADYKPQIDLGAVLPDLNRSIELITLSDGSSAFRERSQMSNRLSVSLTQNVSATGATVFASTGLQRLDVFKTQSVAGAQSYLSNPIFFGVQQPLFEFNQLKWNKKLMPLRFKEAKSKYSEDMEAVARFSVRYYFDLLIAQMDLASALARKQIANDLFELGKNRFDVGNIAEVELLQLEMDVMRANSDISRARLEQQTANENLRDFLGVFEETNFTLNIPSDIPDVVIDAQEALKYARSNRSRILELQRILLEAELEVERNKASTGLSGSLTGEIGVTGFGSSLKGSYNELLDQEVISLRLTIPIADWGKSKARYEIAKSNYELANLNTELDKITFEREVVIAVQQFELVKENIKVARLAFEASKKRYELTKNRYLIGKVDVTQLNLADREQETQRQNKIQAMNRFWEAYYEIRSLTLYDFINNKLLVE